MKQARAAFKRGVVSQDTSRFQKLEPWIFSKLAKFVWSEESQKSNQTSFYRRLKRQSEPKYSKDHYKFTHTANHTSNSWHHPSVTRNCVSRDLIITGLANVYIALSWVSYDTIA